jgi:ADP-heptose:LPS heptosyltransferase
MALNSVPFSDPPVRFSGRQKPLLWIDRYLGVPICWFLTLGRRLAFWTRSRGRPPAPQRVLFLKLAEQGSSVLAFAALQAAAQRFGRENVYFMAFEENRFIVDLLGLIPPENVITVETTSAGVMVASGWRELRGLRRRRIDACIDMEFFTRFSAAIAFLSGARIRVGFHTFFGEGPYRGDLFTHRLLYNPHLHTSDTFLSLVAALDADPAQLPTFDYTPPPWQPLPLYAAAPEEVAQVRAAAAAWGVTPGSRLVLLNANAGDLLPLRKWAQENYAALAQRLVAANPDLVVAFTGSPEEAAGIEALVRRIGSPRCVSVAGQTTLRQLLVFYGQAQVLVTNDSGPAHFAALTAVDVVTLFGPETPLLFAARGPRNHALWAGIACSPCVNAFNSRQSACRNNVCMQALTVDHVLATVQAILARRAAPAPLPSTS